MSNLTGAFVHGPPKCSFFRSCSSPSGTKPSPDKAVGVQFHAIGQPLCTRVSADQSAWPNSELPTPSKHSNPSTVKLPVIRTGGNDDRPRPDTLVTIEAHKEWVFRTVDARHRSTNRHGCAELFGLYLSLVNAI